MATPQHGRDRPLGETTGSAERPVQHLAGPTLTFDLAAEARQLRAEDAWRRGEHNAKTLMKEADFRVVLVAAKSGGRMREHQAPGRLSIQTLSGRVRVHLQGESVDLPVGHLLTLEPGIAHDVEALVESDFLLTIAWPNGSDGEG